MDLTIATWVGFAVSTAIGIVGIVFAAIANGKASEANDIAADALKKADESNQIAAAANDLSAKANAIAERQAAQQADPSHTDWSATWDEDLSQVTLRNTGRHTALGVSVLIRGKDLDRLSDGHGDVARDGEIVLPFPDFVDERRTHNIDAVQRQQEYLRAGNLIGIRPWSRKLSFDIRWTYASGRPGNQQLELKVK